MGSSGKQKFKKLQKVRIWPSALFLIISFLISVFIMICGFISIVTLYFLQDRLKTSYDSALYVSRMFPQSAAGEDYQKIMDYLENDLELSGAVYLLDESGGALCGFGEQSYDLSLSEGLPANKDFSVYMDKNAKYAIVVGKARNKGGWKPEIEQIDIGKTLTMFGADKFYEKQEIFSDPFWFGVALADGKRLMIQSRISLYDSDLLLGILLAMIFFAAMLLPLVFLAVNLIRNVQSRIRMLKLVYTDPVTDGNNWLWFEHSASKILGARKNADKLFALVDVTLMKYGSFCTFHGVKEGEALLKDFDGRLADCTGKGECCARYGKASFALLLQCAGRKSCEKRVADMVEELSRELGEVFHAGIYFIERERDEGGKFLRKKDLDIAEYYNCATNARASIEAENRTLSITFDQMLRDEQLWEHHVEEKMQRALADEEFKVYLQPKYNPVSEELTGAEALVRWVNDEDGFVPPGRFVPLFEKNGFIMKLDDYMLSHVAKLQSEWLAQGKQPVPVSVNVSRAHFADPNLAEHICRIVDEYKVPHNLIEIELTESAFFDDKEALLNTVRELKGLGFDISMDDFGAGYSSLNSLKDLPLDVLKLDAEFFRGNDGAGRGEIVVSQAIHLAKELNMRIVAEGVEKKDQVDFLAAHDCDMIQGFYFAKPMPADEYAARLKAKG